MARLRRISPIGVLQHIVQRGNNQQACIGSEEGKKAYLNWLKLCSTQYLVDVHAWVLMPNHVHLLCTPQEENAVSRMMESIGRMYVQYYNDRYYRSGTLWEVRVKSSFIDSEQYLLALHRYIELNPVRAGMVEAPAEYNWSSYGCNALGIESELHTPCVYLALGESKLERVLAYRNLLQFGVAVELLKEIRASVNKGLALGSEQFTNQIEAFTNRRVTARKAAGQRRVVIKVNCTLTSMNCSSSDYGSGNIEVLMVPSRQVLYTAPQ